MRLYLEASINFLDGYPASERTPEYWLSWSLEYLCVEHVKRRISKSNAIRFVTAGLKPHRKHDLIVTL
ncbi:hypothetical protein CWN94_02380 [Vibrio splendidus]|nr:hypothetical protein CWN94_02380 [Vibrio splendidus]PTP08609.1 hypothetical protein CWN86_07175 [Vibrio splendidus]PTP27868.1 hypothetical protein CWN92_17005 [Vibrio splendidus]CDT01048.1 hypothetical protein VCR6J2_200038 [Vibrio coralliirubri]